jgi:peptidoglycan DL-endopeptidase CwlO
LTAGAIALAVIAPALDPAEHAAEAVLAAPPFPASAESVRLGADAAYQERALLAERASRASGRRVAELRPAVTRKLRTPRRPMTLVIEHASPAADRAVAGHAVARHALATRTQAPRRALTARTQATRRALTARTQATRRAVAAKRALARQRMEARAKARSVTRRARHRARQVVRRARTVVSHRRTGVTRRPPAIRRQRAAPSRGGMTAVIAYARSQVGKRYVTGGEGGSGFDCSGLTMRAYERAGIRLPHSSTAQAGRARSVSRSQARAGDLVIGPGHVGIYMGNGMMIDAGNHRTGVVYRKLYSGLRVARL